jgi:hypothetical protein
MGSLLEDRYKFVLSHSLLRRMRNVSDKSCRESQNTHFILYTFFLENLAVYEIMWKPIVETDRPQLTIWLTRIECWMLKAKNTLSECVILNAYPLQQWFHETAYCYVIPTLLVLFIFGQSAWLSVVFLYYTAAIHDNCVVNGVYGHVDSSRNILHRIQAF